MKDSITVLLHDTALATKRWRLADGGKKVVDSYGQGKWFSTIALPVEHVRDLAVVLAGLAQEPSAFVIRGELIPGRDPSRVRRAKKQSADGPPDFREVPRRWMCVDADHVLSKEEAAMVDASTPAGAEQGVRLILSKLPSYLREATCTYQLSSSAGMKPGEFRAHLWFWLDRPVGEVELRRWAGNVNDGSQIVDPAVFGTVQPHYTATPLFDVGLVDPIEQRIGIIPGIREEVALPKTTGEGKDSYLRKLEQLRNPLNDRIHDHIRDAAAAYFCARGADADAATLFAAMRPAVDDALELQGRGGQYDDDQLAAEIESGREFARQRATAGENLLLAQNGAPAANITNAVLILTSDERWQGVLGLNERNRMPMFVKQPPFDPGYAGANKTLPRPIGPADANRIATWLGKHVRCAVNADVAFQAAITICEENAYDPFRQYLEGVAWDNVLRLDSWLIDVFGCDDTEYVRAVGAMWMISLVARQFDPGCQVDTLLILEGLQGKRKSTFFRILAGGPELFSDQLPDISNKDAKQHVHGPAIIEVKEWDKFARKEMSTVKAWVDLRFDRFRRPYGRIDEIWERRCVFCATTNEDEYLRDDSNRRFWPVPVREQPDLAKILALRDQLWAEAVARYRAGEKWYVEADDPRFVLEQDARRESDSWEDIISDALDDGAQSPNIFGGKTDPIPAGATAVTVAQVLEQVFSIPVSKHEKRDQMRVANIFRKMKWVKTRIGEDRIKSWCRPGTEGTAHLRPTSGPPREIRRNAKSFN